MSIPGDSYIQALILSKLSVDDITQFRLISDVSNDTFLNVFYAKHDFIFSDHSDGYADLVYMDGITTTASDNKWVTYMNYIDEIDMIEIDMFLDVSIAARFHNMRLFRRIIDFSIQNDDPGMLRSLITTSILYKAYDFITYIVENKLDDGFLDIDIHIAILRLKETSLFTQLMEKGYRGDYSKLFSITFANDDANSLKVLLNYSVPSLEALDDLYKMDSIECYKLLTKRGFKVYNRDAIEHWFALSISNHHNNNTSDTIFKG
jgi:hypothetical protein